MRSSLNHLNLAAFLFCLISISSVYSIDFYIRCQHSKDGYNGRIYTTHTVGDNLAEQLKLEDYPNFQDGDLVVMTSHSKVTTLSKKNFEALDFEFDTYAKDVKRVFFIVFKTSQSIRMKKADAKKVFEAFIKAMGERNAENKTKRLRAFGTGILKEPEWRQPIPEFSNIRVCEFIENGGPPKPQTEDPYDFED